MNQQDSSPQQQDVQVHYRSDYKPYPFDIERVGLSFDLQPEATVVDSVLQLVRKSDADSDAVLELDGEQLELLGITVDGEVLSDDSYS